MNIVCGENISNSLRKRIALVSAIVTNNHLGWFILKGLFYVVAQALGISPKRVAIHSVCANAHDSSHPPSSKGEIRIKGILERFWIVEKGSDVLLGFLVERIQLPFDNLIHKIVIHQIRLQAANLGNPFVIYRFTVFRESDNLGICFDFA